MMQKQKHNQLRERFRNACFFLLIFCGFSLSVNAQVSGKVTSSNGEPLIGVSVLIKGTEIGTITDLDGNFSLPEASSSSVLTISYLGYVTTEVEVNGRSQVDVVMQTDESALDEVVVVGYGSQRKASLTGAVASVSAKQLNELSVPSVQSALQGRVAGIQVTNTGSPGVEPIVRVRGVGSINYASNPMYVVDGFPVGGLNDINTNDIETLDVLKDASSAAIYGSRAANGVILITTKKGSKKDNKIHVDVDTYYGTQKAWKTLDVLSTEEYIKYGTTLLTNAGSALPDRWKNLNVPTHEGTTTTFAQTSTNMQDYLFRTAGIRNTTVSVSSNGEKSRYYASLGTFGQDGIFKGTEFGRYSARFNSEHNISKVFTFGQTLTLARTNSLSEGEGGGRTQIANAIKWVPYLPPYNPTEIGGFTGPTNADGSDPENLLIVSELRRSKNTGFRTLGTAYLGVKLLPFLTYKVTGGFDLSQGRNLNRTPIYTAGQFGSALNQISDSRGTGTSSLLTNQLTFEKNFGGHNINLIGVAEQQYGDYSFISSQGSYSTNQFSEITPNITKQAVSGGKDERVLLSYLSRLNYDYNGKYLLSASIRRDGSSLFAPGKKWGTFPAISAGWRVSEESFLKDNGSISDLKLRASYGLVGNISNLPNYAWQSVIGAATNYPFSDGLQGGLSTNQLGNADLGWELTKMTDFGIDIGLFDNKLEFSADYYVRETADSSLILARSLPVSLGYSNATISNFGAIKNTGLDLQLGYNNRVGDFTYGVSGNFSTLTNIVTKVESPINAGTHGETGTSLTRTDEGNPVQYIYGFKVDKIYQNEAEIKKDDEAAKAKGHDSYQGGKAAPGDIRFVDVNGDGTVNDKDRTKIGNVLPKFIYGLNLNLGFKGIDFTLFGQGVYGNDIYNNLGFSSKGMTRLFGQTREVLNAWTPTNTNTNVPRAISGDPNGNAVRPSDRFIEKGSFFRIKNLAIGYTLGNETLNSISKNVLRKMRLYVSGQNLLTITKYSGFDPEIGARNNNSLVYGVDDGQFPTARTIQFGLQLGF